MDPLRWEEIRRCFEELVELDAAEQARRLEALRSRDPDIGAAVAAMLAADEEAPRNRESLAAILAPSTSSAREAALPDPLGLSGRTLSHFRVLEPLGAGGMGFVYRAEDTRLRRQVALKFLLPQLGLEAAARERFLHEARSAGSLDHPNLCTIYDVEETDEGRLFLSMPLYPGETLKARLARDDALPVSESVQIARQIAQGLACAHAAGIVHRDLKPGNVMLLPDGTVKILDFGLAKARDMSLTEAGGRLGTVAYMAPEQLLGQPVDHRADLWALGVVLYEMLTGGLAGVREQSPLRREFDLEQELVRRRADTPAAVTKILAGLLSHRTVDRLSGAEEVARRLQDLDPAAGSPSQGRPRVSLARGRRRKLTRILAGATAVAILMAVFATMRWWKAPVGDSGEELFLAVLPFCVSAPDEALHWGEDLAMLLGQELDGLGRLRQVDHNTLVMAAARERVECQDRDAAADLARRHGAELFLLGNLLAVGSHWRATTWLYDSEGQRLGAVESTVPHDSLILALKDSLAVRLVARIPGVSTDEQVSLGLRSSPSVNAVKEYVEGERRMRVGGGSLPPAEAFRRAVQIDTAFAVVWLRLSWLEDSGGESFHSARAAAARAARHSDRLPAREQSFLTAWSAYLRGNIPEALERYRDHLSRYPTDAMAWDEMADIQFHYGPVLGTSIGAAREGFERVLQLRPDDFQALDHLSQVARFEGRHAEADSLRSKAVGDGEPGLWALTGRAARSGRPEGIDTVAARLRAGNQSDMYIVPKIAVEQRNFDAAKTLLRVVAEPSRPAAVRAMAHLGLARLAIMQGRIAAAIPALDSVANHDAALSLEHRSLFAALPFVPISVSDLESLRSELRRWQPPERADSLANAWIEPNDVMHRHIRLYLIGLLSARLGDEATAVAAADSLRGWPSPEQVPSLSWNLAQGIRAYVAWTRSDPAETLHAVEGIRVEIVFPYNHSSAFANHALERYLRAESLRLLGRYAESLEWFEGLEDSSPSHWPYLGMVYLRRSEILKEMGDLSGARAQSTLLAELWSDPEPTFRRLLSEQRM